MLAISPVDFTQHEIQTAHNRDHVAHLMAAQQFGQDLQIDKGRAAQLGAPGIFAAIADEVHAQFALAALDGKVGLAARWSQSDRRADADWPSWHLIDGYLTETDALIDFIEAHLVTREAVALLTDLWINGHLAVGHIGTIHAQIPVHAACAQHRAG